MRLFHKAFLSVLTLYLFASSSTWAEKTAKKVAAQKPAAEGSFKVPTFLAKFVHDSYFKHSNGNQMIGKSFFHWSVDEDLLRFDEESEMKIKLFNKDQVISTTSKTWTNSNLEIQKIFFLMKTADSQISIEGDRLSNSLRLRVNQAGQTQTKEVALQEPVLVEGLIIPFLLMKGLPEKSTKFSAMILEPSAMTTVPVSIEVSKKGKDLWTVDMDYLQHRIHSEIGEQGNLLLGKSDFAGLQIAEKPATPAELKKMILEGTSSDLVELAKVQFPNLPNSKDLKKLSVKISGIDFRSFDLNRHRQTLRGDVLTTEVEKLPKETSPVQSLIGQTNLEAYLEGDAMTEVYDPIIQKQSREIVGSETDLWKRALLVHQFVYKNIEKIPTVSIPNAIEVLKTKKGDCNEHAILFTALARAAGIPTRTVVGLVYSRGAQGTAGFFYHAWVEVYTGKDWIALDPTWNEVPADATHLAFVEGGLDQQVQVTSLMGKIKLSLVSSQASSM